MHLPELRARNFFENIGPGAPRTLSGKTGTEIRLLLVNTFLLEAPELPGTGAPETLLDNQGAAIGSPLVSIFFVILYC